MSEIPKGLEDKLNAAGAVLLKQFAGDDQEDGPEDESLPPASNRKQESESAQLSRKIQHYFVHHLKHIKDDRLQHNKIGFVMLMIRKGTRDTAIWGNCRDRLMSAILGTGFQLEKGESREFETLFREQKIGTMESPLQFEQHIRAFLQLKENATTQSENNQNSQEESPKTPPELDKTLTASKKPNANTKTDNQEPAKREHKNPEEPQTDEDVDDSFIRALKEMKGEISVLQEENGGLRKVILKAQQKIATLEQKNIMTQESVASLMQFPILSRHTVVKAFNNQFGLEDQKREARWIPEDALSREEGESIDQYVKKILRLVDDITESHTGEEYSKYLNDQLSKKIDFSEIMELNQQMARDFASNIEIFHSQLETLSQATVEIGNASSVAANELRSSVSNVVNRIYNTSNATRELPVENVRMTSMVPDTVVSMVARIIHRFRFGTKFSVDHQDITFVAQKPEVMCATLNAYMKLKDEQAKIKFLEWCQ